MSNEINLWSSNAEVSITSRNVTEIVGNAMQLSVKDQRQIVTAFDVENYQMVATYVWSKTITAIKNILSKMGSAFIGEMLDRPDIDEKSNLQHVITDFDSIQLAEDLGLLNNKSGFRLKQAMELMSYYNNPDLDDDDNDDFQREDAITVLRSCIQGILGHEKIELKIDFKNFRSILENTTLTNDNPEIFKLESSPYFFKRATIRILLSIVKSSTGAQLENALANSNLIIPRIWSDIKQPEKWQVGRCYAELFTDGQSKAASGLKSVLLKVKGFDFVPEDLRSNSFIKAANSIIVAHENMNNYYNEPAAVMNLLNMGSTIPTPAFPISMTAILVVRLGNFYGISRDAQKPVEKIIETITYDRWKYYFNECLPTDSRILYKLSESRPRERWFDLVSNINNIEQIRDEISNISIKNIIKHSINKDSIKLKATLQKTVDRNGYLI